MTDQHPTVDRDAAARIFLGLQTVLAGNRTADCMAATMDTFACQVVSISKDHKDARRWLRKLEADIWAQVLNNWDNVKAVAGETGVGTS